MKFCTLIWPLTLNSCCLSHILKSVFMKQYPGPSSSYPSSTTCPKPVNGTHICWMMSIDIQKSNATSWPSLEIHISLKESELAWSLKKKYLWTLFNLMFPRNICNFWKCFSYTLLTLFVSRENGPLVIKWDTDTPCFLYFFPSCNLIIFS